MRALLKGAFYEQMEPKNAELISPRSFAAVSRFFNKGNKVVWNEPIPAYYLKKKNVIYSEQLPVRHQWLKNITYEKNPAPPEFVHGAKIQVRI